MERPRQARRYRYDMPSGPVTFAKTYLAEFQRNDLPGLAAELAYRFLFAVFPFGLFLAALAAFVAPAIGLSDPTSQLVGALGDNLPADVANSIRPELEKVLGQAHPGLVSPASIGALWAATGGTNALIKGLNRAFEVEDTRSFIVKTALAVGLTVLATVGVIGSFVTVVGGSLITQQVAGQLGLGGAWGAISLLRWPLVGILLTLAVAVLFHVGPNLRPSWRWCLIGGAVFTVGWLIATALFGLYVANVANFGATYGGLGSVIVLMLWFYLTGLLIDGIRPALGRADEAP